MYWCSTCEIKASMLVRPTVGVPGPASNGIINDCRPDKNEHYGRTETPVFCKGTNGEHGRDSGEHELVDAEHQGRDLRAPNGGLEKNALKAEVACRVVVMFCDRTRGNEKTDEGSQ